MNSPVDDVIRAVTDSLERRALALGKRVGALDSVRGLVAADEADIALDYLVNTANAFRLPMRQDEYDRLMEAARRLDPSDWVTDIDPQLLFPA
ncbi:hypothetical protein [Streptomyces liangshanensis]|uniref:hypothetical protein n=1 Tax=Streptomyces liangshanensis TaxID=2717324 RepID=UPI0036DA8124